MTKYIIVLESDEELTRHETYARYGEIAEALASVDLALISIADDSLANKPSSPSKPARKPRGPNKAKVAIADRVLTEDELLRALDNRKPDAMPPFLKRERE